MSVFLVTAVHFLFSSLCGGSQVPQITSNGQYLTIVLNAYASSDHGFNASYIAVARKNYAYQGCWPQNLFNISRFSPDFTDDDDDAQYAFNLFVLGIAKNVNVGYISKVISAMRAICLKVMVLMGIYTKVTALRYHSLKKSILESWV